MPLAEFDQRKLINSLQVADCAYLSSFLKVQALWGFLRAARKISPVQKRVLLNMTKRESQGAVATNCRLGMASLRLILNVLASSVY